jgi:hypothetical protein
MGKKHTSTGETGAIESVVPGTNTETIGSIESSKNGADDRNMSGINTEKILIEMSTNGDGLDQFRAAGEPTTDQLFDLDKFRVAQNFADEIGVRKALTVVAVERPNRQTFVRTHPSEAYRMTAYLFEENAGRATYLVHPDIISAIVPEVRARTLITTVTRQGDVFLWPVPLPSSDGRQDVWGEGQRCAADMARTRWVRIASNQKTGRYDVYTAEGTLDGPEWPEIGFQEIVALAFKDRVITSLDHPVILRLRGLA